MSYGRMCLRCRKYVWQEGYQMPRESYCSCAQPVPSDDAINPIDPADAVRYPDVINEAATRAIAKGQGRYVRATEKP